jgi:hypothetical protein
MHRRSALVLAFVTLLPVLAGCTVTPAAEPQAAGADPSHEVAPETSVDPWAGYFDDRAADPSQQAVARAWGTLGAEGEVAAHEDRYESLAAGAHIVAFECAGAPSVTVTAAPLSDVGTSPAGAVTYELACPGGVTLPITTDTEGLALSVDSHGEPGAYLVRVDPAAPAGL